jgi:hypothetical protein
MLVLLCRKKDRGFQVSLDVWVEEVGIFGDPKDDL